MSIPTTSTTGARLSVPWTEGVAVGEVIEVDVSTAHEVLLYLSHNMYMTVHHSGDDAGALTKLGDDGTRMQMVGESNLAIGCREHNDLDLSLYFTPVTGSGTIGCARSWT